MPPPLIAPRWRALAVAAAVAGAAVVVALGALTYHEPGTSFDNWVRRIAVQHIGDSLAPALLDLSNPTAIIAALAVVAAGAAIVRRWDVAVLAVVGPLLAVIVTEQVLKPLLDRPLWTFSGSYPSGHETGVASTAVVLLVVAGQVRLRAPVRAGIVVVLTAWIVAAAVGLVRNFYHYATDTIGAMGVAAALVLTVALLVDAVSARVARTPARTARAA